MVTLTRFGALLPAQLLCGRLDAEGIECFIPDETMANQTWHLSGAIGGIRVQVRRGDLGRAQSVLDQPGFTDAGADAALTEAALGVGHDGPSNGDNGSISPGDRAAFRSLRVALVSLWLMGLIHPYSFWLAIRALGREDLTSWGRRRAWVAVAVSLLGCCFVLVAAYQLTR
jgi:hypothetical protein